MSGGRPAVKLPCCGSGGEAVRLLYVSGAFSSQDSADAFMEYVRATPPQWVILFKNIGGFIDVAAVSFCPFCGARVPGVKLRAELDPTALPSGSAASLGAAELCDPTALPSGSAASLGAAELAPRIMVIVDGGHYCDTCEERLDACDCLSPEMMWEATT